VSTPSATPATARRAGIYGQFDLGVWRAFAALAARPGVATTGELIVAALAVNAPAGR